MIATHRGRNTDFRENTIPSFDHALKLGCEAVECDLRLTLDSRVVVNHGANVGSNRQEVAISKTLLRDLSHERLLTIEELFDYIDLKDVPFYLELKNSSAVLVEKVVSRIKDGNLWERVHIIGFSFFIGSAVAAQSKYPKLKVVQLITIPLYSYVKKPHSSYGVALGWFDGWPGTRWLFRRLISVERLVKLRELYEKNGFSRVMAGVINNKFDFEYFDQAGITDIITDNVIGAVDYFKSDKRKTC